MERGLDFLQRFLFIGTLAAFFQLSCACFDLVYLAAAHCADGSNLFALTSSNASLHSLHVISTSIHGPFAVSVTQTGCGRNGLLKPRTSGHRHTHTTYKDGPDERYRKTRHVRHCHINLKQDFDAECQCLFAFVKFSVAVF